MTRSIRWTMTLGAVLALATPALAQQSGGAAKPAPLTPVTETAAPPAEQEPVQEWKVGRTPSIQYVRLQDRRGLNVFETTKEPGADYRGFRVDLGAAFTSQVQNLSHRNSATPVIVNNVNTNQLADIGFGFNNSTANLYLHAQLAPGVRVQLTSYLSARHHNETWVKDGFIQIDESPIDFAPLKALMQFVTIRMGHFEINYGDAHFRRSDNGNALYNPFIGNYIMDAFTTEIGGEVYVKAKSLVLMGAVSGGEVRGTVLAPKQRGPAYIGKAGFDRQVNDDVRVRLTGSVYHSAKAMSNTLYGGDRAGSRFYYVLENTAATESAQFTSGLINPGLRNQVTALQANPFVKVRGLEVFGVIERAKGKATAETSERQWNQYAADVVYRFLKDETAFVGVRYNRAEGALAGITGEVGAKRWEAGAGWFALPGLLLKAGYAHQEFFGYPATNIKRGGVFKGLMLEGVVAF